MHRITAASSRGIARHHWLWAITLLLVGAAALWLGWVGFIASDDSLYYAGTVPWLEHPPFPGTDHWSTRFPLTLTFAAVLALVGRNFAAFAITSVLFYVALVAVSGMLAQRIAGVRTAWIAALLVATMPVVVSHASTVSVDLTEAAALLLGVLLLTDARAAAGGHWRAGAAGIAFGVAVLCRETSALPLIGLVPLFLLGRPVPRSLLIAAGIGCVLVLGGEALFQWATTGAPLRRWDLAFHHDSRIDRSANLEGNFLLWAPIDPILVLLVNDDFGLLFWLFGAALIAGPRRYLPALGRRRIIVLGAMAAAMFLLVAVLTTKLVLNPRYFTLPALAAAMVVAAWIARLPVARGSLVLTALVSTNLLLAGLGNAHPRWREEVTIAAALSHPHEMIWGVPNDVARAEIPIAFEHVANLRPGHAPAGGLEIGDAADPPSGKVMERHPGPPTRVGAIVKALGLAPLVPQPIARRLLSPSPEVVLVRRGG